MRTVHEVSELAHVSVRTLHHYDQIGLLKPSARSKSGYRLYSDDDLMRLQQIMLFRELEFPLADIKAILESPDFDQGKALEQQIELLELRREHISNVIDLAKAMKAMGVRALSFKPFDTSKIDEYAAQAKASWGDTPQWTEYQRKWAGKTKEDEAAMGARLMELFVPFGRMAAAGADPSCEEAQAQVARIQAFITENAYTCTNEILAGLGRAYGSGGDFTRNINEAAGPGAAEFAAAAVEAYCSQH
ncbi:MAG: MerR family transcriptional regulator [Coriobacteriaceae bacterium]|nr:MerR family transcriptional regulator [Coriobacteriaceae bacterium]